MAEFQESYFQDEVRDGFKIEGMMKRAWAAQIEVLEIIDDICRRYGLVYYADWGTLLGAVRHKGLIPWDDDIDIAMKRQDYMRFIEVAQKELPRECSILSVYTEEKYTEVFARVINSRAISFEAEHLKRYHGCPYIVGVDIFPLDRMPVGEEEKDIQMKLLEIIYEAINKKNIEECADKSLINEIEMLCNVKFDSEKPVKNQLLRLFDTICQLYDMGEGGVIEYSSYIECDKYIFEPEWYKKWIYMPFETFQIPVPQGYDKILTSMYGEYLKPIFNGAAHDYPFYKKQQEIIYNLVENINQQ